MTIILYSLIIEIDHPVYSIINLLSAGNVTTTTVNLMTIYNGVHVTSEYRLRYFYSKLALG